MRPQSPRRKDEAGAAGRQGGPKAPRLACLRSRQWQGRNSRSAKLRLRACCCVRHLPCSSALASNLKNWTALRALPGLHASQAVAFRLCCPLAHSLNQGQAASIHASLAASVCPSTFPCHIRAQWGAQESRIRQAGRQASKQRSAAAQSLTDTNCACTHARRAEN